MPGVNLTFTNPIPHSGLFQQMVKINDGDSYENVLKKLAKTSRNIKGKLFMGSKKIETKMNIKKF